MGYHERSSSPVYSSSFSCPRPELNPLCIDSELWLMAEHRIFEILCSVQPALASEQKRHDVISYIMRLIKAHYSTEVFAVGSVPLKTYLPDGDIDLTILSHQDVEEELAKGVLEILQGHEHDSRFEIKNIQYIEAKVKILKLLVNNISVDISFNQMEGLSALCFLEQRPAQAGSLLLMPDFLRYCKETYAVPVKALDRGMQQFTVKSINIVDPLKENNNLGRSVHRGMWFIQQS
ncbi:hypothetical protein LINPERPRIM_LOCUS23529 [Linum perenne]